MAISSNSEYVHVNSEPLSDLAATLVAGNLVTPDWRLPLYPATDDAAFVQFLGIQNALNFCFVDPVTGAKYGVHYQGVDWGGAMGVCSTATRH